jgi:hypothetical protein
LGSSEEAKMADVVLWLRRAGVMAVMVVCLVMQLKEK